MAKKSKKLTARVTHLEMTTQSVNSIPVPTRPPIALLCAKNITVHFYRYLYERVGRPHHWYERRIMTDEALANVLQSKDTHLHILYVNGVPAGFFELNSSDLPQSVELVYFGLMEEFQGMKLGNWFLHSGIQNAWALGPQKVTLHTNTLDHPAALGMYQKHGFSPAGISEETVTVWE